MGGNQIDIMLNDTDKLVQLLTDLVHHGWPWDADGIPNDIMMATNSDFLFAIVAAKKYLENINHD